MASRQESQSHSAVFLKPLRHIVAGGSAGLVEVCLMHPLDVIKTRLQIQRGADDPTRYTSLLDCVKKMIRNEGTLSFYKGIIPPILAETPKRATKFFSFECYRSVCSSVNFTGPWSLVAAGLGSGLTEGVLITPFERVKVHIQAQRNRMAEMPSTWSAAKQIVKSDGLGTKGLLKGLTATLGRHGLFNTVYFGTYHNLKLLCLSPEEINGEWQQIQNDDMTDKCDSNFTTQQQNSIPLRLLLGFIAGTLSSLANIPFDVAKSRIQGPQPLHQPHKYSTTLATLRTVVKEEGFIALYKGIVPKILRLGPGGAIMLVVYEQVLLHLESMDI